MLRDILGGKAPEVTAAAQILAEIDPDILLLTDVDWDHGLVAGQALAQAFAEVGVVYPHLFALRPNTGLATGLDMDGDGRLGGPRDAQGYGAFAGQGGMLLLSRLPIDEAAARDFSDLLWQGFPGALLPEVGGAPFPSAEALAAQRLSHTGHWDVPVILPSGTRLHLLAFAATPPVFDGPEDRNGKRNHDEITLWLQYLNGGFGAAPEGPVVVLGKANLDPVDGEGLHGAMTALLNHPRLQDAAPISPGGALAAMAQGGANEGQQGDPALDTADWSDDGPGNLRVSYVLPDAALTVLSAGVHWPADEPDLALANTAGRHRLVWVDVAVP